MYDIRTGILPFLFIFNTDLLLINVGAVQAVFVFIIALVAMLTFAAASQQYMFVRNKWWESIVLLLIAFTMFRPGYWLDQVSPPYDYRSGTEIVSVAGDVPADGTLRIVISGPDSRYGEMSSTTLLVPLGAGGSGKDRLLDAAGLTINIDGDTATMDEPVPGSALAQTLVAFDFYGDEPVKVDRVEVPTERMDKEYFYIPAIALLFFVIILQRRRLRAADAV